MALGAELSARVLELAGTKWEEVPEGNVVPGPNDLTFGNDGRWLNVCILYADLSGSTKMVDETPAMRAAEYYKAFLHCAGKLIRKNEGEIQAYDGDRVMGVYLGNARVTNAVVTALEINFAVKYIINPTFASVYTDMHKELRHTVGIDDGKVLVAKTGVRTDSDLVWVGPAANYAAKLNSFEGLDHTYPTRITAEAFARLNAGWKRDGAGAEVWDGPYNNLKPRTHYRSHYSSRIE